LSHEVTLLEFRLGRQPFAIPCEQVVEVLPMLPIRQLVGAPAAILGVATVRGGLLPLLDPRVRLGLPAWEPTPHAHIISADAAQRKLGLVVDSADDVFQARLEDVCRPGDLEPRVPYSIGILQRGAAQLLLVDLDAMVNHDEWGLLVRAATGA
jgi:purine-binding chemotaxis protein CheW